MSDLTPEHEERLRDVTFVDKPEGPIAAAIIAGGIGAAAIGVLTTVAEANTDAKDFLQLTDSVGPLAGKTLGAVLIWLIAWAILAVVYKDKPYETKRAFTIAVVLIAVGALGTFPIFFQAFAPA